MLAKMVPLSSLMTSAASPITRTTIPRAQAASSATPRTVTSARLFEHDCIDPRQHFLTVLHHQRDASFADNSYPVHPFEPPYLLLIRSRNEVPPVVRGHLLREMLMRLGHGHSAPALGDIVGELHADLVPADHENVPAGRGAFLQQIVRQGDGDGAGVVNRIEHVLRNGRDAAAGHDHHAGVHLIQQGGVHLAVQTQFDAIPCQLTLVPGQHVGDLAATGNHGGVADLAADPRAPLAQDNVMSRKSRATGGFKS